MYSECVRCCCGPVTRAAVALHNCIAVHSRERAPIHISCGGYCRGTSLENPISSFKVLGECIRLKELSDTCGELSG